MSYGLPVRFERLGLGLASQIADTDLPPGAALVEENISLDELGAIRKRNGFTRFIPEIFGGNVSAIIPVENCFGQRQYMVASSDLRIAKS